MLVIPVKSKGRNVKPKLNVVLTKGGLTNDQLNDIVDLFESVEPEITCIYWTIEYERNNPECRWPKYVAIDKKSDREWRGRWVDETPKGRDQTIAEFSDMEFQYLLLEE